MFHLLLIWVKLFNHPFLDPIGAENYTQAAHSHFMFLLEICEIVNADASCLLPIHQLLTPDSLESFISESQEM